MDTSADKTQKDKSQAVEGNIPKRKNSGESTFQFMDNRPEAIAQQKLQEMANSSPCVQQLKAYQEMADNSTQIKQLNSYQAMADNFTSQTLHDKPVVQLISNKEKDDFERKWEGIEQELDVLFEYDSHVTLEIASSLEEIRAILRGKADKINGNDLKTRMHSVQGWISSFRSQFDRRSFAIYKLLGPGFENIPFPVNKNTQATIYKNGEVNGFSLGNLLTKVSDFPGLLYYGQNGVSITNILGDGRVKEAESYLREIGINQIKIVDCGNEPDDIIDKKIQTARAHIAGKKVSLSIMPLSTIMQANGKNGVTKITWSQAIGGDPAYQFEIVETKDKTHKDKIHFIADIRWANGILVENLLQVLENWNVTLESVNLFGIAGSLTPILGPGTLVVPRGEIHSLDPHHKDPVSIPWNNVFIPGAMFTMEHGNVSSILEETDNGIRDLLVRKKIHVVEMEAYHLMKKLKSMNYTGKLKIVFKIHDVVTSEAENISIPPPQNAGTMLAKIERDNLILQAFEII